MGGSVYLLKQEFQDNVVKPSVPVIPMVVDYAQHCVHQPPDHFNDLVVDAAREFQISPSVVAVTVYKESKCDPQALGSSGEIGLGQILPRVWTAPLKKADIIRRTSDLWKPKVNLRAAAFILSQLYVAGGTNFEMFRRYNGAGQKARLYAHTQVQQHRLLFSQTVY
jgi:soluble lytic murein transglycosylase-like protein